MKNIMRSVLCFLIALTIASCGDDDGGGIDTNLFGTFVKTQTVLRDCANVNDNSSQNEVCDNQVCETLMITEDQRYTMTTLVRGQEQVENGQVQISETQIRFLPDNSTGSTTRGYSITATTLTLSNETVICTEDFVYTRQ